MSGPVLSFVRLFLATLYPAYYSFKAVKNKNVKEYVKWMMYWIIYAFFMAIESILDPFVYFWLPFYSEVKVVLLLYLVAPATRGSGVVYRRWLHPLLCDKEEEIDNVLQRVKEQGTNTALSWVHSGVQWLGGVLVRGAVKGGGGLLHQLKRSYSMAELGLGEQWEQNRFTDVTEEEGGYFSPGPRRRHGSQEAGRGSRGGQLMRSPERYLSNESLSSGYNTDYFPGPGGEPMDTGDYELWHPGRIPSPTPPPHQHGRLPSPALPRHYPARLPSPPRDQDPYTSPLPSPLSAPAPTSPIFSPVYAPRQKGRGRTRPAQPDPAPDSEDEETFYDSESPALATPFGATRAAQLMSPSSSCCPSDREDDRETDDDCGRRTPTFQGGEVGGRRSPRGEVGGRRSPWGDSLYYSPGQDDGEVTPTRSPSPLPPVRKSRDPTESRFSFWTSRRK